MRITFKEASLQVTEEDARELYHALQRDIEQAIDNHWVYHPASYLEHENRRLHMMRVIGCMIYDFGTIKSYEEDLAFRLKKLVDAKAKPASA